MDLLHTAPGTAYAVNSHGLSLSLTAEDPALAQLLRRVLPPASYRGDRSASQEFDESLPRHRVEIHGFSPRRRILLDGRWVASPSCEPALLDAAERCVDQLIAERSPRHLALHGGVVGFDEGALLVVGSSHSGKTTLVDALVQSGARYLSDDLALVDTQLRVHPYPRPLRRRSANTWQRVEVTGEVGAAPLPIRWIVLPTYREDAEFAPRPLAGGAALLAMLAHAIPARQAPERTLDILGRLSETVPVWTGERGDAEESVRILRGLIGQPP